MNIMSLYQYETAADSKEHEKAKRGYQEHKLLLTRGCRARYSDAPPKYPCLII